jgi:3-oxoacyl-[acyl-carrier-protein] synthase II
MGVQDDLAVTAAGKALRASGLLPLTDPERVGLYLAVGYIPFEAADLDLLASASTENGEFSMRRFSTVAFASLNPLLTFRCLSNMPAFHISVNFDIQGPYFVTYPGPGQFYLALQAASDALREGFVDVAVVGGVAHQRNALVEHHFSRIEPPVLPEDLLDAAGFIVLERGKDAESRGARPLAFLHDIAISYRATSYSPSSDEGEMGPASLPVALATCEAARLTHRVLTRDGIEASSVWEFAR